MSERARRLWILVGGVAVGFLLRSAAETWGWSFMWWMVAMLVAQAAAILYVNRRERRKRSG